MSFWTGIKDFLFGAPKLVDNVFDKNDGLLVKAGGFIDDLSYTDEEKERDFSEMAKNVLEFVKTTLPESTERSQTRRSIAILWIKAQLGLLMLNAISIPIDHLMGTTMTKDYFALATCSVLVGGTIAIIIFFFGAYGYGTYIKTKEKKD